MAQDDGEPVRQGLVEMSYGIVLLTVAVLGVFGTWAFAFTPGSLVSEASALMAFLGFLVWVGRLAIRSGTRFRV